MNKSKVLKVVNWILAAVSITLLVGGSLVLNDFNSIFNFFFVAAGIVLLLIGIKWGPRWVLFMPAAILAYITYVSVITLIAEKYFVDSEFLLSLLVIGLGSSVYVVVAGLVAPKRRAEVLCLSPMLSYAIWIYAIAYQGLQGGFWIVMRVTGYWLIGTLAGAVIVLRIARPRIESCSLGANAAEGTQQRYKGTVAYQDFELDRRTFFGRDHESRQLLNMVLSERLVVLFAKSGMGKSSLINVGLLEPLRKKGFLPITVRLNNTRQKPIATLFEAIHHAVRDVGVDLVNGEETSAWRFFKTAEFWSVNDELLRPVLILDQFEELFTLHGQETRREFFTHLAELMRGRSQKSKEREGGPSATEHLSHDDSPPDIKIVVALREEFLANLQDMAAEIPNILQNRIRLGALTKEAARAAIVEPARLEDATFGTERFAYDVDAVNRIVTFLARNRDANAIGDNDEVEPVQLQLICQYLEELIRVRQCARKETGELRITEAVLGGDEQMQQILEGFYDRTIDSLRPRRWARKVRHLCEKLLISDSGRRLTKEQDELTGRYKIEPELLRQIVDARLLRAESWLGGTFYEVSHDRLVEPIRQSNRKLRVRRMRLGAFAAPLCMVVIVSQIVWFFCYREEVARLKTNLFGHDTQVVLYSAQQLIAKHNFNSKKFIGLADPVLNPCVFSVVFKENWDYQSASKIIEHIDNNYHQYIHDEVSAEKELTLLGALIVTLDDIAPIQQCQSEAAELREEILNYFRSVHNLGKCTFDPRYTVKRRDWDRCLGKKSKDKLLSEKLGINSELEVAWFDAYAYAALCGGRLPLKAELEDKVEQALWYAEDRANSDTLSIFDHKGHPFIVFPYRNSASVRK
jgi:hypothetical protein